jgi:eukaryotic-like serine/threonine-protein kinase
MPTHADVPGDLLYGLLSLQAGLIDQTSLVAAFHAWTHDSGGRSMSDILIEHGALTADEPGLVAALVAAHLRRHGGDREGSLAHLAVDPSTIDGLADVHDPDLDATISRVGLAVTRVDGNGKSGAPPALHGRHPSTIDGSEEADLSRTRDFRVSQPPLVGKRYRLLRRHDSGGLGVIYVALDTVLNREVALKLVRPEKSGDPQSRARLLLEAEITAGLEHPGIIPVHDLGIGVDGHPFYVMRFIKGKPRTEGMSHDEDYTLKAAIAAFHEDEALRGDPAARMLGLQKLLRRFLDVCNAVEYAHARGVLHRDLKPSNIVLGKHGETLVIDWGLAKAVGRSGGSSALDERTLVPTSGSDSAETQPGFPFGTLPYMPGEQAAGDLDRIGTRSDVYSLGATLYTILTGRRAFEGPNQALILAEVKAGQFPPPRQLDPRIDRALEAICLKAMEREPEDRYPSPLALAEDIELWLADAPVSAWREPASVQLRRWSRRHRPLVAAAAVLMMMTTLASAGAALLIERHSRSLEVEQKKTEMARAEADANFAKGLEAGDDMVTRVFDTITSVLDQKLATTPQMEPVRRALARDAVKLQRAFLQQRPDEPVVRSTVAKVLLQASNVERQLNEFDRAREGYDQAAQLLEGLRKQFPTRKDYREQLAETLISEGELFRLQGQRREALNLFDRALELVTALQATEPSAERLLRQEARSRSSMAVIYTDICRADDARAMLERAVNIWGPIANEANATPRDRMLQIMAIANLASARLEDNLPVEALHAADEALQRARALFDGVADNNTRFLLALSLRERALALAHDPARLPEANGAIDDAIKLIEKNIVDFPSSPNYKRWLALGLRSRFVIRLAADRDKEADDDLAHARDVLKSLVARHPETAEYHGLLGLTLEQLIQRGHTEKAVGPITEALDHLTRAKKESPENCKISAAIERLDTIKAKNLSR